MKDSPKNNHSTDYKIVNRLLIHYISLFLVAFICIVYGIYMQRSESSYSQRMEKVNYLKQLKATFYKSDQKYTFPMLKNDEFLQINKSNQLWLVLLFALIFINVCLEICLTFIFIRSSYGCGLCTVCIFLLN